MSTTDELTKVRQSIRQGWEEVAPEYSKDRLGIFKRSARRLLQMLQPTRGSVLLDVACGSGAVALQAAELVGPKGKVMAVDIARNMMRLSYGKAVQATSDIGFSQMDAECLAFADATFDSVACAFSLFQFPRVAQALAEMWRVLRPGGRLVLSNWGPGYFSPIASLQGTLFREFGIRPLLTNPVVFKPADLEAIVAEEGFDVVEMIEETDEVTFATPEEVWAFDMDMGPFPMMLRQQLSADRQTELLRRFVDVLQGLASKKGIDSTFHVLFTLAEKGG